MSEERIKEDEVDILTVTINQKTGAYYVSTGKKIPIDVPAVIAVTVKTFALNFLKGLAKEDPEFEGLIPDDENVERAELSLLSAYFRQRGYPKEDLETAVYATHCTPDELEEEITPIH